MIKKIIFLGILLSLGNTSMSANSRPFSLNADSFKKVKIILSFESSRSGAGIERVTIQGDLSVELYRTNASLDMMPKIIKGVIPERVLWTLLEFLENRDFLKMPDTIENKDAPYSGPHSVNPLVISLVLPDKTKSIILNHRISYAMDEVVGAIKLTAGVACSEMFGNKFFGDL
jgi:hypothetical protein